MHNERSCPCQDRGDISTARLDAKAESSVLTAALAAYPELLSDAELMRELVSDEAVFGERDAVDRAVHALVVAGLLNRARPLLVPTLAARRFHALAEQEEGER
jgi:hypothetical protein